ncbi:unnamed protein product [Bemisia tabaci]|uniref:Zinc transporter ZIP10 n=1 Tax=Bemisia tabaci TaxID=7038 RepID=A0A9P0AAH5_BEMTA|nr:unnamed protein product [Bemisia tabaci]
MWGVPETALLVVILTITSGARSESNHSQDAHNLFLQELFSKYGHDGRMTFEGFEHLLANLGLGKIKFDGLHTLFEHRGADGSFEEMHDARGIHQHQHDRKKRSPHQSNLGHKHRAIDSDSEERNPLAGQCLSPPEMLITFGLAPDHEVSISPSVFLEKLCPTIIYELDLRTCQHETSPTALQSASAPRASPLEGSGSKLIPSLVWLYSTISIISISVVGLLSVAVVPLLQRTYFSHIINFLVALAVGTLTGDALLHLLPHALMSPHRCDATDTSHTLPVLRATTTFLVLFLFFLLETIFHRIKFAKTKKRTVLEKHEASLDERGAYACVGANNIHETETTELDMGSLEHRGHCHAVNMPSNNSVSSVAWMVIMGDGIHNLTDGLAIGAAFSSDPIAGFATTLAVFTHELPHELGDFAVLIQSGLGVRQALMYNIFSSVLSFVGMVIGVLLGDFEAAVLWIYAATAGTFLYIALVDLVPEMTKCSENSMMSVVTQIIGILTGGGIMCLIALYEDDLRHFFYRSE